MKEFLQVGFIGWSKPRIFQLRVRVKLNPLDSFRASESPS
jgi:hypothetical protein